MRMCQFGHEWACVFFIDNVAKTFSDYMEDRWLFPMSLLGDNAMTDIWPEVVSINSK